jgi:hypothetical protein
MPSLCTTIRGCCPEHDLYGCEGCVQVQIAVLCCGGGIASFQGDPKKLPDDFKVGFVSAYEHVLTNQVGVIFIMIVHFFRLPLGFQIVLCFFAVAGLASDVVVWCATCV